MKKIILMVVALLCLSTQPAIADPIKFPQLTGHIVDEAHVLSDQDKTTLTQEILAYEKQSEHQFVVVTLSDLQGLTIEDYGVQLGRTWGIGHKVKDDGIMLLYYPGEGRPGSGKIRIEVGYGLEYIMTDADAKQITSTVMVPIFKQDLPRSVTAPQAILAGARAVMQKTVLTKEQKVEMDKRAADERKREARAAFDAFMGFVSVCLMILTAVVGGFGVWYLVTNKRRKEKKRLAAEALRAAEERRLELEKEQRRLDDENYRKQQERIRNKTFSESDSLFDKYERFNRKSSYPSSSYQKAASSPPKPPRQEPKIDTRSTSTTSSSYGSYYSSSTQRNDDDDSYSRKSSSSSSWGSNDSDSGFSGGGGSFGGGGATDDI